jgi:hypothetical protein
MAIFLQCLGCGIVVKSPKTINYMYEKCDFCTDKQKDMEEKAINVFLHAEAERKLDKNVL